jgi:tetratricopeptide (TPR) repeat protein
MDRIDPKDVRARLDDVVAAMKKSGAWDIERPPDEAFVDAGAFGMRTMAFEQWLRFVFVPSVEERIASGGPWPGGSMVAVQAVREGDTNPLVAELVPSLSAFDALFEPEPEDKDGEASPEAAASASPLPTPAASAYARSWTALHAGDHAVALDAIREALAADPRLPNAHNLAGWILLGSPGRTPEQIEEAIGHFREAMGLAPDDPAPLANLCDALVAAGRALDAIAEAEAATADPRAGRAAAAHNWLGWRRVGVAETHERAIEHFRQAVQRRPGWGVARANLGNALEIAHRSDEAYDEHARALGCADDFDRAFSHERRGAYEARSGWLRNALRSFRAAVREDHKRGGKREATYREAMAFLEQQMHAAGVEPAPADRDETDARWLRECELELPAGLGDRNEWGELLADEVVEVERLVRAERWADAVRQLEKLHDTDAGKLWDAVGYAERGADLAQRSGRRDEAIAMMRLVVEGYRAHASWSTSGGEGMERMATLDEKTAKLRAWERSP